MTAAKFKEKTNDVIIPASVAIAVLALAAKSLGLVTGLDGESSLAKQCMARQIEFERMYREDRHEIQKMQIELIAEVKLLRGKLEK